MSFGTAERRRMLRGDGVAHEACIFAKGRKDAFVEVCTAFIEANVGSADADAFRVKTRGVTTPRAFADALSRSIRPGWERTRNRVIRKKFKDFAAGIGGQLTYAVTLPVSPARRLRTVGADD
jgi:hypothetical protein